MKAWPTVATVAAAVALSACAADTTVDLSKPEGAVNALFVSAKSQDPSQLPELCDPTGNNDSDTRRLCRTKPGEASWDMFVSWFAGGAVVGKARVDGDVAELDFTFGPERDRRETMKLVRHDERWYLYSF